MAGIGKLALGFVLVTVMAFVLVGTLSSAKHDQTTDPICQSGTTCNGTIQIAEVIGTQTVNFMVPVIIIIGVLFLLAVFAFLRKRA